MTVFPGDLDDDQSINRVDDNITEIGSTVLNQIRAAIFAMQAELGINPAGSAGSVVNRLDKSLTAAGDIKASALSAVGLVTLPITDNQVASSAGIQESKLSLSHSTSDLNTKIVAAQSLINSTASSLTTTTTNLLSHIGGSTVLSDGTTSGRHVASHIDLNAIPSDTRDPVFNWDGLTDKDGALRSATTVADGLDQINEALTTHENLTVEAHPASAITVDTTNFVELQQSSDTVQKALDDIDDSETLRIGLHRATMHENGVPRTARSNIKNLDGYSQNIVPSTQARAFLVTGSATSPIDNNSSGDDLIVFMPDNTDFIFDSQFTQVRPGDTITINYGNGVESKFPIESVRFIPNTEWVVRINGTNLFDTDGYTAFARIDKPLFDPSTQGVLAVAAANSDIEPDLKSSLIVAHPRSASVVGLGFDSNQLDSAHFKLYIQLYPTGNPTDRVITLPFIDVTGNAGATPGQYTIDNVVQETNNAFREGGYNYRFIAFNHKGNFGLMLADPVNNASFSVVAGEVSGSTLIEGSFTENVIGDAVDGLDALGFGSSRAAIASPSYIATFPSTEAAADLPIKIFAPLKNRNYIVNGVRRDTFADTFMANSDGYWPATLTSRDVVGTSTVEVTYTVDMYLDAAELQPGKTIVVQPVLDFANASYSDNDYGRFIIKEVTLVEACSSPLTPASTIIKVVNGIHGDGDPVGFSTNPEIPVRLYFSEDSAGFNALNIIDTTSGGTTYNRLFEVYVSDEGKTFTHERARIPKQSETANLLNTNSFWNIKDVSPKLRGFRDDSSTSLKRFVRLYIMSYDSTTGEFDGYIGKRDASSINISNTGTLITGRKNIPVRFYDESNIDYIELEFFDTSVSPGVSIMSSDAPRYVDIEVFPSIRTDDQFFLLATCEVENSGSAINVESIVDRREFGNISEKNFTDSAIDFISAVDRFVHENAVLRGLSFDSVDPSDDRILNFNGGFALVNGKVVPVNAGSAAIPEVWQSGTSKPTTVNWAVCVNEDGNFEPIILTNSKTQFFVTSDGANSYYVPSVTFTELVNERKDLTIIATVVASISSISLAVTDARRFVLNHGFNSFFLLSGENNDKELMFATIPALAEWISNTGMNQVMVHGDLTINEADRNDWQQLANISYLKFFGYNSSSITISNSLFNVNFGNIQFDNVNIILGTSSSVNVGGAIRNCEITVGEGSNISLESDGILEDVQVNSTSTLPVRINGTSNMVLRRVEFDYDPATLPSFTAGDHINEDTDAAMLFSSGHDIDGLIVEECEFVSNVSTGSQRSPSILLRVDNGDVLNNIRIRNNFFEDDSATARQAAIAIVSTNTASGAASGAIIINSEISNNKCDREQGIYIVSTINNASVNINAPGFHAINTTIERNVCGVIGYSTSGSLQIDVTNANILVDAAHSNLRIENNTVKLIMPSNNFGTHQADLGQINFDTGIVFVRGNSANWINTFNLANNSFEGDLFITDNRLIPDTTTFIQDYIQGLSTPDGYAISVYHLSSAASGLSCHITNNTIHPLSFSVDDYDGAIYVEYIFHANIANNNIYAEFTSAANIIYVDGIEVNISNNILGRAGTTIASYITTGSHADRLNIVDNVLDTPTIDGSDTNVIDTSASTSAKSIVAERNINQTVTREISAGSAYLAVEDTSAAISSFVSAGAPSSLSNNYIGTQFFPANPATTTRIIFVAYDGGTGEKRFVIQYDLSNILPSNVRVVSASVLYDSTDTFDTNGDVALLLASNNTSGADSGTVSDTGDLNAVDTDTLTVTPSSIEEFTTVKDVVLLRLNFNLNTTNDTEISINPLQISYRW